jgi:hypothetical protein
MGVFGNSTVFFNNLMRTNRIITFITVASGLITFSTTGCGQNETTTDANSPVTTTAPTTTVPGSTATIQVATIASPDGTKWADIQDYTYDQRAQFFAGLNQLEAKVDAQTHELTAKRAVMNRSDIDTKDWDLAMKEMEAAQSYLKAMGDELRNATRDTWNQEKDKVGQAWVRTQNACQKVESSTTN